MLKLLTHLLDCCNRPEDIDQPEEDASPRNCSGNISSDKELFDLEAVSSSLSGEEDDTIGDSSNATTCSRNQNT